jgi:hypothetical protein
MITEMPAYRPGEKITGIGGSETEIPRVGISNFLSQWQLWGPAQFEARLCFVRLSRREMYYLTKE